VATVPTEDLAREAVPPRAVIATGAALRRSGWRAALDVYRKDWRSEWRSRAALNAVALFSLAAPVALGFSVARQKLEPEVLGGLLWTVLFFAALIGLPRAFVKEEENGTAALLRLHFSAEAVLWGKTLSQLALLGCTQLAAVPIFVMLLNAQVELPGVLLLCLILGDIGLAVASALLGAMAAQARSRGALFSAIAVPVLLPLLIAASLTSGAAFGAVVSPWNTLAMIGAYDVLLIAGAWMLFEFVWS
jgi:heme exporter protein B